jgi:hypothetical protein
MSTELRLSDPLLTALFEHWKRLKGERLAPARKELRPEKLPFGVLPQIYMMDVVAGPPLRFRYRLAGTGVVREFGSELTGKFADEVDLDMVSREIIAEYQRVVATAEPAASNWSYVKKDGRHLRYEHVILPLSDDGKTVNILLGGAVIKGYG